MPKDTTLLACQAKGNPALIPPLWNAVRRLVCLWANRYAMRGHEQGTRLYDTEDLIQSGYLALVDAVAGYDTEAGTEFTTYLHFHVRRRFAEVSGHRGTKCRPEVYAASLDIPLDEDTSTTRLELLEDPAAHLAYDDIIEREANRQAYTALMGEVNKLPENQHKAIRLNVCEGLPIKDTAAAMGCIPERARQLKVTALNAIRRTKTYRRLVPDFRPVSLSRFRCTFTSEQEEYVLWKEEQGFYDD